MNLSETAPIRHSASIAINAPIDRVWQIMVDIDRWPTWNPEISSAHLAGPLQAGSQFKWKAGPSTITSTLQVVKPKNSLAWTGKTMGIHAVHIWQLEKTANGTVVATKESWDGIPARLFKKQSQKALEKAINSGLNLLKQAAEKI